MWIFIVIFLFLVGGPNRGGQIQSSLDAEVSEGDELNTQSNSNSNKGKLQVAQKNLIFVL